jgi:hypothetical protein
MSFEDRIKKINDESYLEKRVNQLKYLLFENIGLPKDNVSIDIRPMLHRTLKSEGPDRFVDVWSVEFFIDVKTEVDPVLSEIAYLFNKIEKNLDRTFKTTGINQFMEFVKNPDASLYNVGIFVSMIDLDGSMMTLHINIDYETIPVEGAGSL